MIYQKITCMIFEFDGNEEKHTQFKPDAKGKGGKLVEGTEAENVKAHTAMEGVVSLGGRHLGREF